MLNNNKQTREKIFSVYKIEEGVHSKLGSKDSRQLWYLLPENIFMLLEILLLYIKVQNKYLLLSHLFKDERNKCLKVIL